MEEEEIIIILKDMVGCDAKEYNSTQVYAIQGLLDLYEKEKEKNSKAIEHIESCKTSLENYILSPNETEGLLEILKGGITNE